jgi:hypothetical protein
VLDLHTVTLPSLEMVRGLTFRGAIRRLAEDGFIVVTQADVLAQITRDYQVSDTADSRNPGPALDVKQVRAELTDNSTDATFLLTENGLYLLRRPAVELETAKREPESVG